MAIEKSIQDYYEALLGMFASDGWGYFIEDHEEALDALMKTAHEQCKDNDSWQERRGQINKLTHLISYETFIKNA